MSTFSQRKIQRSKDSLKDFIPDSDTEEEIILDSETEDGDADPPQCNGLPDPIQRIIQIAWDVMQQIPDSSKSLRIDNAFKSIDDIRSAIEVVAAAMPSEMIKIPSTSKAPTIQDLEQLPQLTSVWHI